MRKKRFLGWVLAVCCIFSLCRIYAIQVSATEATTETTQPVIETEPEVTENSNDALLDELYLNIESLEKEVAYSQEVIEKNQSMIEYYHELYSTWTDVIGILLSVFGVIIPLVIPFVINKINKRNLEKDIEKFNQHSTEQYNKLMRMQNAMMLSAQGDYWSSNQCFEKLLRKYPDDPYIRIYMAKNSFRELDRVLENEPAARHELEIYNTINAYIDWFYKTDRTLIEELMIGNFFGDSTVIEVALLISRLAECDETNATPTFMQTCKKACKYILDVLNVENEDDLVDLDQTDVCVMNYKIINFQMCEAYFKNKRIDTEQQLRKTIRLYSIDGFSKMGNDLEECQEMLKKVLNERTGDDDEA